jgi:YidC/Oxa1 family membrane protein insertase
MFHTIFYVPLYNALVWLTALFFGNIGLAVVALTLLVKIILSPLSYSAIKSQIEQKKLQPLIENLKKNYPDQKEQSQKMMELYKEHKTNPFAGCLLILLQLPVIIALYRVFLSGSVITASDLYSWVHAPNVINTTFLGLSMSAKGVIILALLAGLSQYLQMRWSPAMQSTQKPVAQGEKADVQSAMAESMTKSMRYSMPILITVFAFAVPGAVALYWIVSNIFMIAQEQLVMRRQRS